VIKAYEQNLIVDILSCFKTNKANFVPETKNEKQKKSFIFQDKNRPVFRKKTKGKNNA